MGSNENCWRGSVSKIVESEILQSALNDPKLNSRNQASKVPHIYSLYHPESQIFVRFTLRLAIFEIFHNLNFPIDPHVKISKCHKIVKAWPIAQKSDSLYSIIVANVLINFDWHRMKAVGGVAFWNFQPHMVVFIKRLTCHRIFNFWQIAKNVIAYISPWLWYLYQVWLKSDENCWRSSVLKS